MADVPGNEPYPKPSVDDLPSSIPSLNAVTITATWGTVATELTRTHARNGLLSRPPGLRPSRAGSLRVRGLRWWARFGRCAAAGWGVLPRSGI